MASSWSRYANAFAEVAREDSSAFGALEEWGRLLKTVPELGQFLARRDIPIKARKELVLTLAKGKQGAALRLMLFLVERNLVADFTRILDRVRSERDRLSGQLLVNIESAAPMDGESEGLLKDWLCRELDNKEVTLSVEIKPELVTGFIASAGSRRIDMSYRGRLLRLERQLLAKA